MTNLPAFYDNRVIAGDIQEIAQTLPDGLVNCIVTSPPYWGLRDYGTAEWSGGSEDCDHRPGNLSGIKTSTLEGAKLNVGNQLSGFKGDTCPKCGAHRLDQQVGLEETPEAYVETLVSIFRELRRVLRYDGTLWLNLGDSYAGSWGNYAPGGIKGKQRPQTEEGKRWERGAYDNTEFLPPTAKTSLPPKNLVGIPWRVALALQADGWYLRMDNIWHKPNPMPESVKDRPTRAHEYVFLLSKSEKYYYDYEAIKEPTTDPEYRNKRSVWTIPTRPYKPAHFATFPPTLVYPCILAGCPPSGLVLDPFFGAGTVGVVAKETGRNYLGVELNPEYVRLAEDRIHATKVALFATGGETNGVATEQLTLWT